MDLTDILDPLNQAQREAVTAPLSATLVLAGAGSGKTRVLTHRMAWLIRAEANSPTNLLAVTFTNKAASEMRHRTEALLNLPTTGLWIGTFHGLAHRLLRYHAADAKLPEAFQILDSDDQLRVIKRVLRSLDLDEARWPPRQVQWFINGLKDEGLRPQLDASPEPYERQMHRIYSVYQEMCNQSGLVDFAELLLRCFELFKEHSDLRAHYQNRFRHVLVDEFQDTNTIQYAWLRLLTPNLDNLFVVGDDDQSIYGWRGARVENLQRFRQDYPDHRLVRLEQNYRSTGNILGAANALIANNEGRLGKELWTDGSLGSPLMLYNAFNEQDEALFAINRIQRWIADGYPPSSVAILYRSNAQSRSFEERLMQAKVPYRVYGGLRFFERAEIKDALAYLRLVANPHDDTSFERIVNTPTRGIGAKTLELLRERARDDRSSLWTATESLCQSGTLAGRTANALIEFLKIVEALRLATSAHSVADHIEILLKRIDLEAHYRKEQGNQAEARMENLGELVNAARQFDNEFVSSGELPEQPLNSFLAQAALEAGEGQTQAPDASVQLMTLHSAKGLEFDLVFLVGLDEGVFPSMQSLEDPMRLAEERRLCYVGITRARRELYLTHAESRRYYGKEIYPRPSRFLREIPEQFVQDVRGGASTTHSKVSTYVNASSTLTQDYPFKLGQRVRHAKFGDGIVLHLEGSGSQARAQINFADAGAKWLMLAYANLQPL